MTEVTLEMVFRELINLKRDMELIKLALIPEESLDEGEIKEILRIETEMEKGEKITLEDSLKEICQLTKTR
jgi:hypothetical protein